MKYKTMLGVSNAKTTKGEDLGYLTGILYLAPSTELKGLNLCKFASNGCKKACLFTAGRGKFRNVYEARINKTKFFRDHLNDFFYSVEKDINKLVKRAAKLGLTPVVRLNGTSDIRFEYYTNQDGKNIFELFPDVIMYDYTKDINKMKDYLNGKLPKNYHLTFSKSESNKSQVKYVTENGGNVAIVFNEIPSTYLNKKVINGDDHDLRFLDDKNVIVGLKSKGDAKKDKSGFVVYV